MSTLDHRLRAVAQAVRPGAVTADIGTDHAYLICELVQSGKCPRGYAADIGVQPLEAARRHICAQGLSERIVPVLSDGLRALPLEEIDDIVLAGMGGELIARIVLDAPWVRDPKKRLILQPMTKAKILRRTLYQEGFALLEERAVLSGKFLYTVMTATFTGKRERISERMAQTGLHWNQAEALSIQYLNRVRRMLEAQAAGLRKSQTGSEKAQPVKALADEIARQILVLDRQNAALGTPKIMGCAERE